MQIPLSSPDITEDEIGRVCEVLRSGVLSLGPCIPEFEEKFAGFIGTRFAVAVNSGTSALHLAVRALGITAGDEVITTAFSFVASTNCLLYEGAAPLFVDIDPHTLNLDPVAVRHFLLTQCRRENGKVINRQTGGTIKAILPVHVFGMPCDMEVFCEIAREFNLHIIEDACEAIGATFNGRNAGTFGDVAAFAFYPNKQITTGEGGMIVTDDERIAGECRSMRNQGRGTSQSWLDHERLGYNYRLSEIHAALGLVQLERINQLLRSRELVADAYNQALRDHKGIVLPAPAHKGTRRSWFVYVVQVAGGKTRRDAIIRELRAGGIGCQAYFPAIHTQPYFRRYAGSWRQSLPHTENAAETCVALPFSSRMSVAQIEHVSQQLKCALEHSAAAELHSAA